MAVLHKTNKMHSDRNLLSNHTSPIVPRLNRSGLWAPGSIRMSKQEIALYPRTIVQFIAIFVRLAGAGGQNKFALHAYPQ